MDADGTDNTPGTLDDNLRLTFESPAVDAGNNDFLPAGLSPDLDGNPRINNGTVDMGAYENQNWVQFTASDHSGMLPLRVTVTDLSDGNPTQWLWDFGDGGNSED